MEYHMYLIYKYPSTLRSVNFVQLFLTKLLNLKNTKMLLYQKAQLQKDLFTENLLKKCALLDVSLHRVAML